MRTVPIEIVNLEPQEAVAVRGEVPFDELPAFFGRAFQAAAEAAAASGVAIVGPPFGLYPTMPTDTVTVEAGFPVSGSVGSHGDAHRLVLPGGRAVVAVHVGPYDTMGETYAAVQAWIAEHDVEPDVVMWERYLSDPASEPDPSTWRTQVVWKIR